MRSNHPEEEKLSLYVDGLLDREQLNQIKAHLELCNQCKQMVEDLKGVGSFLRETLKMDPDHILNRSIWPLIEERLPQRKGIRGIIWDWIRPIFTPKVVGSLSAAVIVLLLFSFPYLYDIWKGERGEVESDIVIERVEVEGGPVMIFKTERNLTVIWLMEGEIHEES